MGKLIHLAACCTLLLALAALAAPPAPTSEPSATAPDNPRQQKMREVTIEANTQVPVCKRYVPTGSRIATERCEQPPDTLTAADQAERDAVRRDVAEMRALQAMRDQARTQAQTEALRRAAGGR